MKVLNLGCQRFFKQIKLTTCGHYSKKKCLIFLSFYIFSIVLLLSSLKSKFKTDKYENCTIQSANVLEIEKKLNQNVDNYLKIFLKNSTIENHPVTEKWTPIIENIFVYSTFLEICPSDLLLNSQFCVKFIGIALSNFSSVSPFLSPFKCSVKNNSIVSNEEYSTIELLPENHSKLFTAAFLFCPVKNMFITHASVYNNSSDLVWLPIKNNILSATSNEYIFNRDNEVVNPLQVISLCVRPLYNDFIPVQFSEFLAYYSVMGVDHFIFYYLNSFKPLKMFLKFLKYTNMSTEAFLWDIPLDNDLIHEYGQMAFTQDCIARSKYKFSHTIIVDLDEYVVPQVHENIKSLVSYLDNTNLYAGGYVLPMALFCGEYLVQKFDISPFHILNYNKRQSTYWYHKHRSKYILRPERVRYSGIHFIWKFEKNYKEIFVSSNTALLNHYRLCCGMAQTYFFHFLEFKVLHDKIVYDNVLVSHENKLMNNNLLKFIFDIIFEKM